MKTHTSSTPAPTLEAKEVRFACPTCHQHLAAPFEMVGQSVSCPHCTADLVVPEKSVERPSIEQNPQSISSSSADVEPLAEERPFDEARQKKTVNSSVAAPPISIDSVDTDPIKALAQLADARLQMKREIAKIIVGNDEIVDQVLTAFFARGHCLLMGVPGLAKTLLVNTLAQTLSLAFKRIQFTPDLMPTDITGTNILEEDRVTGKRNFTFRKGPVFTNILLADEINRTPPKTQASLLEAMQEKQVTNGNQVMQLPDPFLVLATQNPLEQEGTYPLPEAQLDRFLFLVNLGYSTKEEEVKIMMNTTRRNSEEPQAVMTVEAILKYQDLVRQMPISEQVAEYAVKLMRATRPTDESSPDFVKNWVQFGCGPRAGQSLIMAAKANAALNGRTDVAFEDIRKYALPTLRHRIALNFTAASEGVNTDQVIKQILDYVKTD